MAARDPRSNPLRNDAGSAAALQRTEHLEARERIFGPSTKGDPSIVLSSLAARKGDFTTSTGFLFHPEQMVYGAAENKLRELIPMIIKHHQQLRELREPTESFRLTPAFADALKKLAQPDGRLLRPGFRDGEEALVLIPDFSRGVRTMCALFRNNPHQELIATLQSSEWLGAVYRQELGGVERQLVNLNPKVAAARKLLNLD